jgi:hypothetical protein
MDEASVSQKDEAAMAKAIQVYAHQEDIEEEVVEDFKLAFAKIDADGEGDICTAELMDSLVVMGVTENQEEIEAWLEMADSDKSGYIDLYEFVKFMSSLSRKIQAEAKNLPDPTKALRLEQIKERINDERMARKIAETGLQAAHKNVVKVATALKDLTAILNLPLEKIAHSESANDAAFTNDLAELNERILAANSQLGVVDEVVMSEKAEKADSRGSGRSSGKSSKAASPKDASVKGKK